MNKKNILIIFSLFLFLGSCKKLDEHPLSFASPENYFNNSNQLESIFPGVMDAVFGSWWGYAGWEFMSQMVNDGQLAWGDLNITPDWGANYWQGHYKMIMNLNFAIAAIKAGKLNESVSQENQDILMGQAKLIRGWSYFVLVRLFGKVPLMTDETENYFQAQLPRSEITEVYGLIVDDLTFAYQHLPTSWPDAQKGRPTSDAAKAMLAKAYLTMATNPLNQVQYYQNARDLTQQIITDGRYSLVPDINNVFSMGTKYGPEMMWSFNANHEDTNTDPRDFSAISGWGDLTADLEWTLKFPEQPRKYAYLETEDKDGVSYLDLGLNPGLKKYLYSPEEDTKANVNVTNISIIRYADVLLMFAEADNMVNNGPTQAAVDAINLIINRANGYQINSEDPIATTSMTKEEFDKKVIDERNWELCFEYDRWYDLQRKRILKESVNPEIQQNFSEDDYLWPIPLDDLRLNPALAPQNPGYPG